MVDLYSSVFKDNKAFVMGGTDMRAHIGYPLRLPYLSIFICKEGSALLTVNFKSYLIKTNDILVLSEDSIASFLRLSEDFYLSYSFIDRGLAAEIAYSLPNKLFSFLWESPICIPENDEIEQVAYWLSQLSFISEESKMHRQLMLRNHLQNFFLKISERMPEKTITHKYSRKETLCWKFWELIGEHAKEHRDVAFYADKLCITPFYLSQLTKGFMNDTPKGLIDRQVILEMKSLLLNTDISIKAIAEALHFEDTSYMNRYFKRHTGVALSEYRVK